MEHNRLTKSLIGRLIKAAIIMAIIGVLPLILGGKQCLPITIATGFATSVVFAIYIPDLWQRCPICGKRTLTRDARTSGDRYTLYDGECRNCGTLVDITVDRELHKTLYLKPNINAYPRNITPIWDKENNYEFRRRNKEMY